MAVLAASICHAQEQALPLPEKTGIPERIADGTAAPAPVKPPPIRFKTLNSVTKRVDATEAPELPDLPPVRGKRNITIQLVADPGLPDPPPPLPPLPPSDPAVLARLAEARARYKETRILFVSASVVDHKYTIVKVFPNGEVGKEVSAVFPVDFNDFTGFATFQVAGTDAATGEAEVRQYALIMSIGNEITTSMERLAAKGGRTYQASALPKIPVGEDVAFTVTEAGGAEALQAVSDMSALYQTEGGRMREARIAREKALEERKAYLLAHPAKPQDVAIQFWDRSKSSTNRSR